MAPKSLKIHSGRGSLSLSFFDSIFDRFFINFWSDFLVFFINLSALDSLQLQKGWSRRNTVKYISKPRFFGPKTGPKSIKNRSFGYLGSHQFLDFFQGPKKMLKNGPNQRNPSSNMDPRRVQMPGRGAKIDPKWIQGGSKCQVEGPKSKLVGKSIFGGLVFEDPFWIDFWSILGSQND